MGKRRRRMTERIGAYAAVPHLAVPAERHATVVQLLGEGRYFMRVYGLWRAHDKPPVQRKVGGGVSGMEFPVGKVTIHDLEACRHPFDSLQDPHRVGDARGKRGPELEGDLRLQARPRGALERDGGMVSFRPKGGMEAAHRVVENTELFFLAESLGGANLFPGSFSMSRMLIPRCLGAVGSVFTVVVSTWARLAKVHHAFSPVTA